MHQFQHSPAVRSKTAIPVVLLLLFLTACAHTPRPCELYSHVIQFDTDGNAVDPQTGKAMSITQTQAHFTSVLDAAQKYLSDKPKRKLIVYVHGGLVSPDEALDAAWSHVKAISADDPNCYPIFVVWNSSLGDTYREHLFEVRQGRKDSSTKAWGKVTFPIYFLSDLLTAVARAPTVWLQQRSTDDEAVAAALASTANYYDNQAGERSETWMEKKRNLNAMEFFLSLNQRYYEDWSTHNHQPTTQMAISIGKDYSEPADWLGRATLYCLTLPTKMLMAPLIDALGSAGWRDMERRAETIVEGPSGIETNPNTKNVDVEKYLNRGTEGGLEEFITQLALRAHSQSISSDRPWEVSLIAHSMGTMVINEVLRRESQREETFRETAYDLPVKNIVYMAAACSIRSFSLKAIPYMQRPNHQDVKFYNLTLHPTAEVLEAEFFDLPPRGSLLCWLDDFLETPETPLDRTLGRWENFVQVTPIIPASMRGRVAVKAFALTRDPVTNAAGQNLQPQQHGDFSDSPFWDRCFWQPDPPMELARVKAIRDSKDKLEKKAPKGG